MDRGMPDRVPLDRQPERVDDQPLSGHHNHNYTTPAYNEYHIAADHDNLHAPTGEHYNEYGPHTHDYLSSYEHDDGTTIHQYGPADYNDDTLYTGDLPPVHWDDGEFGVDWGGGTGTDSSGIVGGVEE